MESIVKVLGITTKPPFRQALILDLLLNINKTFEVHKAYRLVIPDKDSYPEKGSP